jgi:hypothetical protein
MHSLSLIGVDFSSRPTRRKPIVVAHGQLQGQALQLQRLETCDTLEGFATLLQRPGPWVGGFDLPFGLPRELVEQLGWPTDWRACIAHYAAQDRASLRDTFAAFCDARPAGAKFANRACDRPAGSSPSMKWVNPPVAWMLHAGVPLLLAAAVRCPAHEADAGAQLVARDDDERIARHDDERVALEAYPGLLARELIGARSYKSDDAPRQTPERLIARKDLVDALEQGRSRLALRLRLSTALREALVDDARGDALDAAMCLLQAGWATRQVNWGLPVGVDALEGWILSA